jgi:tetratricopeptide (TPR) repeat protein
MKKENILLTVLIFSFYSTLGQVESKKDTTIVLKTDDYSNFRRLNKVSPHQGTIAFDTSGQASKVKLIAVDYEKTANAADLQYKKKQYKKAIDLYTTAFKNNNDLGLVKHRYNLACCYTMIKNFDSAFIQLFRIAEKGKYFNYSGIEAEPCFKILQSDNRWGKVIQIVRSNARKIEDEMNANTPDNN